MRTWGQGLAVLLLIVLGAGGGFWLGRQHHADADAHDPDSAATQPADEEKPVVDVTVAPLKRGTIVQTINASKPASAACWSRRGNPLQRGPNWSKFPPVPMR